MSIAVTENCINPASYGEICVHCNACGRFGGSSETIKKSELYMLMEELKELAEKIHDEQYDTLLQQKNIIFSINQISNQCKKLFTELGVVKEVPDGYINMYGLDITYSEWINSEGGGQGE